MFLFVGLGNPGVKYNETRHNAGFMLLDVMREILGWDTLYAVDEWSIEKEFECHWCRARVGAETKILLVKPMTFMNASGRSVAKIVKKFELSPVRDLVLVHDDLDIKLGDYKIQRGKRPKAHNGVESVERLVGSIEFMRVRMGVDSREESERTKVSGEDYVLMKMKENDLATLREASYDAVKNLRSVMMI